MSSGKWWVLTFVLTAGLTAGVGWYFLSKTPPSVRADDDERPAGKAGAVRVEVVRPQMGGMDRTTEQPGTVIAYESAHLYAEVPGYLKTQYVDIGAHVTKGQVLAEIAVPDLDAQVKRCTAAVDEANANVIMKQARVTSAKADLEVAKAGVIKAEAAAKSAKALRTYREKRLVRYEKLFAKQSIEEELVDEAKDYAEAAIEAERAARATVPAAEALVVAANAKIEQAEAEVVDAKAGVEVAQAQLKNAQVEVKFATIVSPYNGIITQRNFDPGAFIKAPTQGSSQLPLFVVEETDKMRVVVQVPDRDAPYTDPGDMAVIELDALPGERFEAPVARIAGSEDPLTRLMRVEIDLANPKGRIRQGMYGKVSIILEKSAQLLSVPSSALAGKTEDGKGELYVVRDGRLHKVAVRFGADNGVRVAVVSGIKADDEIVSHASDALRDGMEVTATLTGEVAQK
jgi:RND family efflux transporter MFP subunit